MFLVLEITGTIAFAVSGALTAINKKFDLFGILFIAFVTAIGGGTLRDIMIGKTPVSWMTDLIYVYLIIAAFVIAIVFRRKLDKFRTSLMLFDSVGLSVFTILGIEKGIDVNLHPLICVALGTISACFGGVLRDILCNDVPVVFHREIYATICILGGILFFFMRYMNIEDEILMVVTASIIFAARLLAVKFKWSLPRVES